MDHLNQRIEKAELILKKVANKSGRNLTKSIKNVLDDINARYIFSARLHWVPANYYNFTLEERAQVLKCKVPQLCKTILFENTCFEGDHFNPCQDPYNSKYYCVIVQYIGKINTNYLRNVIHFNYEQSQKTNPEKPKLSKKKFNFQLVEEDVSFILTEFSHNAICPFGLPPLNKSVPILNKTLGIVRSNVEKPHLPQQKCIDDTEIPIVFCSSLNESLGEGEILYLGGGEVDVKLSLPLSQIMNHKPYIMGDITEPRN